MKGINAPANYGGSVAVSDVAVNTCVRPAGQLPANRRRRAAAFSRRRYLCTLRSPKWKQDR